ncbi:MAG: hypothetical protein ACE5SW_10470 [Nitrososphaeraceae archaeon]
MSKKKEIKIIKKNDYNTEEYTFIKDEFINNLNKIKKETPNNGRTANKPHEIIEKKIHLSKSKHKGRKILGKSMQGHSPIYE